MALCCSRVCWCFWGKDPSPTYTAKSCCLLRQCLEMGRFHSSLLRLLLTSQEGACWPLLMRLPSWHPHGTQQAAGTMPSFTIAGLLWEATCREVRALLGSMFWWGQHNPISGAVKQSLMWCAHLSHQLILPSPVGAHEARSSALQPFWYPVQHLKELTQPCPFWETLWFCTSEMEQTHGNLSAPHRKSCCQTLADDKLCLTMFKIIGLFCTILTSFMQQAPNFGPLITHC